MEPATSLLRIRVIKRFDAGNAEVTNDLPHLHQSTWTVTAMQPGNPGSTALGAFTIPLHPPGTEGFAAARVIYDQLTRYQRVEAYISHDAASLGNLAFAGVITGIRKTYGPNSAYELSGASDLQMANMSRPFPGELFNNQITSSMLKSYMGTNNLIIGDTFNPYTAGNFTSTNIPAHSSGTWSSDTDDGMTVVKCSTGSGAALISKTGASSVDGPMNIFAECTGRLTPSADAVNAGAVGIGMTQSSSDCANCVLGYATAFKIAGRYSVNVTIVIYSASAVSNIFQAATLLSNVDDPEGKIALTIGLLLSEGGNATGTPVANITVNGRVIINQFPTGYVPGSNTWYPFLFYSTPASGTATGYLTDLIEMNRVTADGGGAPATFATGSISTSTHSMAYGVDPGPTFLEVWSRLGTREGWYWRYTPQPYVVDSRTLGKVDFAADPGVDRTASVIFSRVAGNLVELQFNNNADPFAGDTALTGQSTLDGGGISYWRDVGTLTTYGVIQDEALSFTHSDYNSLRRASKQVNANKIALDTLGSKTAVVLRDPSFADTYRELDKITIHDPEMGCNNLACRIMARTFTEGSPTETLILDQFSEDFLP